MFYRHVNEVESKIYFLVDKYNYYNDLKYYYENTNVIGVVSKTNNISNTVWFRNNKRTLKESIKNLAKNIVINCNKFNLPYNIVISLIYNESEFKKYAKSNIKVLERNSEILKINHALGFMQIYLKIWDSIVSEDEEEIYEADKNIYWGCYILNYYYNNKKSWYKTILSYNGGSEKQKDGKSIINSVSYIYASKIFNDMTLLNNFIKE